MTVIDLEPRREPDRNQWGQYLLPTIDGDRVAHQRVTTFIGLIADRYGLNRWDIRVALAGLCERPDLYAKYSALVASANGDLDALKGKGDDIADEAKNAAKARAGANYGDALHEFTELVDRGGDPHPPEPWDRDIDIYRRTLDHNGITIHPEWVERVVILDALRVAGTLDRIVTIGGRRYIADLKTGKNPARYPHDICLQLACYANADAMFNLDTERREPMPFVEHDKALVIHLPPGKGECQLWWFDIAAGWEMVDVVARVKSWRKRESLVTRFEVDPQTALDLNPGVRKNIPPLRVVDRTEFVVDEGDPVEPETHQARLTEGFVRLGIRPDSPEMHRWNRWVRDGTNAGRPFSFATLPTRRRFRLYSAGARLISYTDDDDMALDVLHAVFGATDHPNVGTYLGTLNVDEAFRLIAVLNDLAAGTLTVTYRDNGLPEITQP